MHAFLFVGSSFDSRLHELEKRIRQWSIAPFDIVALIPEKEHISIGDIRSFTHHLQLAPTGSSHLIGVIHHADTMTIEAQNAILKLLEEPPPRVKILLESGAIDQLIPTIVSRCEIVRLEPLEDNKTEIPLTKLFAASIGERLTIIDTYAADRIQAKAFVEQALATGEKMLHSGGDLSQLTLLLRRLQKAQAQLAVNCNPKLVLDRVFLSMI